MAARAPKIELPNHEAKLVGVYLLRDPRTGIVKYVGSAIDPVKRLVVHLRESSRLMSKWIKELKDLGMKPSLEIIKSVPWAERDRAEAALIAQYRETLLNKMPSCSTIRAQECRDLAKVNRSQYQGRGPVQGVLW